MNDSQSPNDSDVRTGLERDIRRVEQRIESTEMQLRSTVKQIGITPSDPLTNVTINPHRFMQRGDFYAYRQAKQARSKQINLESLHTQLERLQERHQHKLNELQDDSNG